MMSLGFDFQDEAMLTTMSLELVRSCEIEGEVLNLTEVRSSIARRLGINTAGLVPASRYVEGIVEMLLDATQHYDQPLSDDRLFGWHNVLFPTGRSGFYAIEVAKYRTGEMQVVSGPMGHEKVHYEAPKPERVPEEMHRFIDRALSSTEETLASVLAKARFWENHRGLVVNERQRKIIDMQFDGFFGKLTSGKWAKIGKCSTDTALNDIKDLVEKASFAKITRAGEAQITLL